MDHNLAVTIVSTSGAVIVAAFGLFVNGWWTRDAIQELRSAVAQLRTAIDLLTGKVAELDTRISVIEDRLKR